MPLVFLCNFNVQKFGEISRNQFNFSCIHNNVHLFICMRTFCHYKCPKKYYHFTLTEANWIFLGTRLAEVSLCCLCLSCEREQKRQNAKKKRKDRRKPFLADKSWVAVITSFTSPCRLFPSCREPHYEDEAKCKVFIMKLSFHSYAKETNFHMKCFARSLTFIMRFSATRRYLFKMFYFSAALCQRIFIYPWRMIGRVQFSVEWR